MVRMRKLGVLVVALAVAGAPSVGVAATKGPSKPQQRIFFDWGQRLGDPKGPDSAGDVAVVRGRAYVVGTTAASKSATSDVIVAQHLDDGTRRWQRRVKRAGDDVAVGVAAGGYGVVVLGATDTGFWVRRYQGSGKAVWTVTSDDLGLTGAVTARGIESVGSSLYVVGSTTAAPDAPQQALAVRMTAGKGRLLSSAVSDRATSWEEVVKTGTDVAVLGHFAKDDSGENGLIVSRLNRKSLESRWSRTLSTMFAERAGGIAAFRHRIYVTGSTQGTLSGQKSQGKSDFVVASYKDTGRRSWVRQFGSRADDVVATVAATPDGPIVVGTLNDPTQAVNSKTTDIEIYSFTRSGTLREQRQVGERGFDGIDGVDWNYHGLRMAGTTRSKLYGRATGGPDLFLANFSTKIRSS